MDDKKYITELVEAIKNCKSRKELEGFLVGILTPKELTEIPARLQIVKLLKKGVSQHEIATRLGVGIATVTRGSKEIAKGNFQNVLWR